MPTTLTSGAPAPDFTLPRDGGGNVALKDFKGRKLAVFFYPKADTPGCTKETIAFNALRSAFSSADTAIVGVSADPVKAQAAFKTKYDLAVTLASDTTHEMLAAYGVWGEKSMYGRKYFGITRATYLIGRDGRIARAWPKVKVDGHAEEVLAATQTLP